MKSFALVALGVTGVALAALAEARATSPVDDATAYASPHLNGEGVADFVWPSADRLDPSGVLPAEESNEVLRSFCVACHSDRRPIGGLSLTGYDVEGAHQDDALVISEQIIRKLQAGMMPPAGSRRPEEAVLTGLRLAIETRVDSASAANPNPGNRTFQRLNQAEYAGAIRDILGLDIDPTAYLPPDTKSANFDNIADVQNLSATLLDAYLNAASEISRLALGDPDAAPAEATYIVPRLASQREHVDGTPFGTRGGTATVHIFPADGDYIFRVQLHAIPTGQLFGSTARDEQIEISIDGERVALLDIDRWMSQSDPNGLNIVTEPIRVASGPRRVAAAFISRFEGPVEDVLVPVGHSLADTQIGSAYGVTTFPHLRELVIGGPYNATGVSETATRARVFSCRPSAPAQEAGCAREIVTRLATQAYRRPVTDDDVNALMVFYEEGAADGFEIGVRTALQAILASPHFLFRVERAPENASGTVRISDLDLASRLSFFLWGTLPDDELVGLAAQNRLSDPAVLEAQVRRMVADSRADALASRFAAQWLRLQDVEKVHPDAQLFPFFDQQVRDDMVQETKLFFTSMLREDRSAMDLINADYTFVNERLARHYGIPNVVGPDFRRVNYPDDRRRGVLGHGSVLTLTSHANRTSPVLRGKWVMEVLLGSPPPAPPPSVPDLEEAGAADPGRRLTVRESMEIHRDNPACNSCHSTIDPLGLALENFDVTGRWRVRDNGNVVETEGVLYDGTQLSGIADLRVALMSRPDPLFRNFTENLMAYAIGRRMEHVDMPAVRAVTRQAAENDYRMSAFILGVVNSPAFQMRALGNAQDDADQDR